MDVFSLEDDDCNELFITQTPSGSSDNVGLYSQNDENGVEGDHALVHLPASFVNVGKKENDSAIYSDISDPFIYN